MAPHLDRWAKELAGRGLRVIAIENGRATRPDAFREHHERSKTKHPVMYDTYGSVTARYGVNGFPQAFIVDRRGIVVWHGHPDAGDVKNVEAELEAELGKHG